MKTNYFFNETRKIRILTLLLVLSIASAEVRADGPDLSIQEQILETSYDAQISQNPMSHETTDTPRICFSSIFSGVIGSGIAAIIILFVVFAILRPHITVKSVVAVRENRKWQFVLKNMGLFPCTNIRVQVAVVKEDTNADETESVIALDPKNEGYFCIRGILQRENDNEVVITSKPIQEIPSLVRIIVLAEHSVSGISTAHSQNFTRNDFREGRYERGEFIPVNSSYHCVYMRKNSARLKCVCWISLGLIVVGTILLGVFSTLTWLQLLLAFLLFSITISMMILVWQSMVHSRVGAHSPKEIIQSIRAFVMMQPKVNSNLQDRAEDAEYEEADRQGKRVRTRK